MVHTRDRSDIGRISSLVARRIRPDTIYQDRISDLSLVCTGVSTIMAVTHNIKDLINIFTVVFKAFLKPDVI